MTPRRRLWRVLIHLDDELKACPVRDARFYGLREAIWLVGQRLGKASEL